MDFSKTVKTAFGNLIIPKDNEIVKIQYANTAYPTRLMKIEIKMPLAELYYQIEELLHQLNPTLKNTYGTIVDCSAFGKSLFQFNTNNKKNIFWFYFQANSFRIQLANELCHTLQNFYQERKDQFLEIYNVSNDNIIIRDDKYNLATNTIFTTTINNVVWVNFNFVDSKPLPLLFDFFKGLNILKP